MEPTSLGRPLLIAYLLENVFAGLISRARVKRLTALGGEIDPATESGTQLLLVAYFTVLVTLQALATPSWIPGTAAACIAIFGGGQALSAWAAWTLGRRWCRRVVRLPGEPPVYAGPYRFLSHPIYLATVAEWLALAVIVGYWWYGIIAAIAAARVLARRATREREFLDEMSAPSPGSGA